MAEIQTVAIPVPARGNALVRNAFMQAVPAATFMGGDAAEPTAVRARTRRAIGGEKRRRAVLRRQARERTPGAQALIVRM
jgi:hypothetical protein